MKKLLLITVIGIGLISGCADTRIAPQTPSGPPNEAQVIAIARAAVATNDTWLDQAEFETPKRRPDGSWNVVVWRIPKVPGGHRFVLIDETGRVTDYIRGR